MKKLFGYCLLNTSEMEDMLHTFTEIGQMLQDARRERAELRRRMDAVENNKVNLLRVAELTSVLSREVRANQKQITTLQGRTKKHLLRLLHESGIPYDPDGEARILTASLREHVQELADEVETLTSQLHAAAGKPGEERERALQAIATRRQQERDS